MIIAVLGVTYAPIFKPGLPCFPVHCWFCATCRKGRPTYVQGPANFNTNLAKPSHNPKERQATTGSRIGPGFNTSSTSGQLSACPLEQQITRSESHMNSLTSNLQISNRHEIRTDSSIKSSPIQLATALAPWRCLRLLNVVRIAGMFQRRF